MFLPLKILHPYQRIHYATYALVGINVLAFLLTLSNSEHVLLDGALNTKDVSLHTFVTSMFLHLSWLHLLGNMLFLTIYGRYVEERLGPLRFLGAYLAFGLVASIFFLAFSQGRGAGASGCISGLMGFVMVGAPWAVIHVLLAFYFVFRTFEIEAFWIVGLWLVLQILSASGGGDGIAYSAHLGGFAAGAGLAAFLRSSKCKGTSWWLDPSPPGGGPEATKRLRRARGGAYGWASRLKERRNQPPPTVVVESIARCASKVAVIKLLMRSCNLAPDDANEKLEEVMQGTPVSFPFEDAVAAEDFARKADALDVDAVLSLPKREKPRFGKLK